MKTSRLAVAVLVPSLFLAGCAASPKAETPAALSAAPTSSAPATSMAPSSQAPATKEAAATKAPATKKKPESAMTKDVVADLAKTGVVRTGKVFKTKAGSFPSLQVKADAPVAKYDPSKQNGPLPKGWTKKDMAQAQLFAANYLVQWVLDNPALQDKSAATVKKTTKQVAPILGPNIEVERVATSDLTGTPEEPVVHDGATPRITDFDIKTTASREWKGEAFFYYEGTYRLVSDPKKAMGGFEIELVDREAGNYLGVMKTGKGFKISGQDIQNMPTGNVTK